LALSDSFVKKECTPAKKEALKKQEMEAAYLSEAGLEDRDTAKLRKTMLSADEAVCAKAEQQENILQRRGRKEDWDEYVDERRRWGRALHHSEIIRKLRNLIPTLVCADGATPNAISLYYYNPHVYFPDVQRKGGFVNIGWIYGGYNPEFEIDLVDRYQRALGQKRGWRTTLLRMILNKLITEKQADEAFGAPPFTPTASNYRRQLFAFRNKTSAN
jgi:hypothetical protein